MKAVNARLAALPDRLRYYVVNAPWSVASNALPGFANYAMILFLAAYVGAEAVGEMRLVLSYFALFALPTLTESPKLLVRAAVEEDAALMARLVLSRFLTGLAGGLLVVALVVPLFTGEGPSATLALIAVLASVHFTGDAYISINQAHGRFRRNFLLNLAKNGGSLVLFFTLVLSGGGIETAVLAYLAAITAFNAITSLLALRAEGVLRELPSAPAALWRDRTVNEARYLSLGAAVPYSLEHIDKLILGHLFSLELLGIYTIGVSTGRLVYNVVKPSIFVFYREFAKRIPTRRRIIQLLWSGTGFGLVLWTMLWLLTKVASIDGEFAQSVWIALVIFASYGIAIANTVYAQAITVNADATSRHVFAGNLIAGAACLALFGVAVLIGGTAGLYVFAMFFPLRHLTGLLYLWTRHANDHAAGGAA